jgi:hypothetical protein
MNKKNLLLILIISLVALAARFIPHAPNFSPLASVMLFAGVYSTSKKYIIIPLIALFVSDLFLGFYKLEIMLGVYGSLALVGALGFWLKKNKNILNTISSTLASALLFFLITNFAVWYFGSWYSHDLAGLALAYNLAIPFFRATLLSNIIYATLLFASYEMISQVITQKKLLTNK